MVDYARLAATTKRLIDANGRTVSIVGDVTTPADAARPMLGPDFSAGPSLAESVIAVFVPASGGGLGQLADVLGASLKGFDQVALIAASSVTASIYSFDRIIDGTDTWAIKKINVLQPADTGLLYELGLSRK